MVIRLKCPFAKFGRCQLPYGYVCWSGVFADAVGSVDGPPDGSRQVPPVEVRFGTANHLDQVSVFGRRFADKVDTHNGSVAGSQQHMALMPDGNYPACGTVAFEVYETVGLIGLDLVKFGSVKWIFRGRSCHGN